MKINHNANGWAPDRTDPKWAERVEREAQQTTDAHERAVRHAQERADRAAEKLAAARARHDRAARIRQLERDLEARRAELLALHREMVATPAGSQHRGKGSHRGVPASAPPL